MKLLKDDKYISLKKARQLCLATSLITIGVYIMGMAFSLLGSKYFILNYQNFQMDRIEAFLKERELMGILNSMFMTLEFFIVCSFVIKRVPKWYYVLAFFVLPLVPYYIFRHLPDAYYTLYPFLFYLIIPLIEQLRITKKISFKKYLIALLRLIIAITITYVFQVMIFVIKNGNFSLVNHVQSFSSAFIYAIEYDIALSVVLVTIALYIDREKGDSEVWTTSHNLGGFSQTSKKQSQKSSLTLNLTKTQRTRLKLLYAKFYVTQLGAFILLMVLPFILGKVLEFLVMYLSFAIARYILGFKYSLHYKKETLCITVGAVVFGILSLAVPFFYVVIIMAIVLGIALAVFLHLSYKYDGFWLFAYISRPDKFGELYVVMDGDLRPHHIEIICHHKGLDKEQTEIIKDFAEGNKKSYMAKKYHYSEKTIERKINEALSILDSNQ